MPSRTLADLSPEDRLALIGKLWDSLNDSEVPLTPAQRDELDRRLADLEQDRGNAIDWADLRAELRQRLG